MPEGDELVGTLLAWWQKCLVGQECLILLASLPHSSWNRTWEWLTEVESLRQGLSWGRQTVSGAVSGPPGP
jgi:hypothetical protein